MCVFVCVCVEHCCTGFWCRCYKPTGMCAGLQCKARILGPNLKIPILTRFGQIGWFADGRFCKWSVLQMHATAYHRPRPIDSFVQARAWFPGSTLKKHFKPFSGWFIATIKRATTGNVKCSQITSIKDSWTKRLCQRSKEFGNILDNIRIRIIFGQYHARDPFFVVSGFPDSFVPKAERGLWPIMPFYGSV